MLRFCSRSYYKGAVFRGSTLYQHRLYTAPAFIGTDQVFNLCTENMDKDIVFVDTRSPEQYNKGSINGAVNIHDIFTYLLATSTERDTKSMKDHFSSILIDKDIKCNDSEHVIIYEDNLSKLYGASCRGYFIFKYMGHPNVSVLEGGYQGFLKLDPLRQQQMKTVIKNDGIGSKTFNYNDKWMCGYQQVLDVLNGARKAHLLDVRDEVEWIGESSSPYGIDFCPRKGRIPGSKWIEWYDFMEDGIVKSKDEIDKMMKAQNINKDDDIIIYCFKGSRASNTLMILNECGYKNVSNYFASWNEWSRNIDLPVDHVLFKRLQES